MPTVFIDGREGTTGLQIHERLRGRSDLELLEIPAEKRKDPAARRELVNAADFLVTCLPDPAAIESIGMIDNPRTRVLDPSTAHRTAPGWVYGFAELTRDQRQTIRSATRVSVPGCHAIGFVAALRPLVDAGVLARDGAVSAFSLTGYSGGGRKMIEEYESGADERLGAPRAYGLGMKHKHLPEMQSLVGLAHPPLFEPVVSNFYQGMLVSIPLATRFLTRKISPAGVHELLSRHYEGERFVQVMPLSADGSSQSGGLYPTACNGTNRLELFVFGHDEQLLVCARLDNLGKGASGNAVQNLNLMIGADEATGLS
ncbi:MAG TPA: N-acetyl-gamma-glutamyl-phosphate reductase [Polyangiaceae bacterium]|nr:N-acetyl-gamma-glutamyl-phosphate reductase [Polyangiaceae bacterium]